MTWTCWCLSKYLCEEELGVLLFNSIKVAAYPNVVNSGSILDVLDMLYKILCRKLIIVFRVYIKMEMMMRHTNYVMDGCVSSIAFYLIRVKTNHHLRTKSILDPNLISPFYSETHQRIFLPLYKHKVNL